MDFLTHHLLRTSARRRPDQEALVHGGARLTYEEVNRRVAALAANLREAGVARGDRVGVFLAPSIPLATSLFAISQAGGAFVPIHHELFPQQLAHIIHDCGMKAIITDAGRLASLASARESCPSLQFAVVVDQDGQEAPLPAHDFDQWTRGEPSKLDDIAIEKDLAAILYTSGSTGRPKGVMLSHANILAGASIVSNYLQITEADRTLAVLPFSFDAGLNQIMTAFQQGG
ncbi:MAG: long-chain fatty acid--CoA ligase, partial [Planctomycetes bacterium]|nr:long-chain fatty acid--CoA ligase [Planctomycetota bacterium]